MLSLILKNRTHIFIQQTLKSEKSIVYTYSLLIIENKVPNSENNFLATK